MENYMVESLKENWSTGFPGKDLKGIVEDGCLFMINFNHTGALLAATTGIISLFEFNFSIT